MPEETTDIKLDEADPMVSLTTDEEVPVVSTETPDADAVREFLDQYNSTRQSKEDSSESEASEEEVGAKEESVEPSSNVSTTQGAFKEVDVSNGAYHQVFKADTSFTTNKTELYTKTYFVPLEDSQVPITEEDQALYLKAVLNDTPLTLTQSLAGGRVQITCRALSVYEQDLMLEAALFVCGGEDGVSSLLPSLAQQIRVAMQTVSINKKQFATIYVQPDRTNRKEQILQLVKQVDAVLSKVDAAKFGFLVRALNVFEHKVAKLNSLAYTGDFWNPAEID